MRKTFPLLTLLAIASCGPTDCPPGALGCACADPPDVAICRTLGVDWEPYCCANHGGTELQCGQPDNCVPKPGIDAPGATGANWCCPSAPLVGPTASPRAIGRAKSCGYCADVYGCHDIDRLCPDSREAWDAMVACTCVTTCAAECAADWCSWINVDPHYTQNASETCRACTRNYCWNEILACDVAQ